MYFLGSLVAVLGEYPSVYHGPGRAIQAVVAARCGPPSGGSSGRAPEAAGEATGGVDGQQGAGMAALA